jgi:hypothetical protein
MRRRTFGVIVTAIVGSVLLTGCVSISMRSGQPLKNTGWQEALQVGTSTREDVIEVLGQPVGQGRALLPVDTSDEARTVWTYYYEEATMQDARRLFLFVFLDGELYDGYLWFSSLPDATPASPGDDRES